MKLLILVSLFWASITIKTSAQDIFFERISPESGFSFNAITSVAEDDNGLLWFACNNRLYHYNTSDLEEYSLYNDSISYSNPLINNIITNKNGVKACTSSGLYSFNTEKKAFEKVEIYFPDAKSASHSNIMSLTRINEDQNLIIIDQKGYILNTNEKILKSLSKDNTIRNITHVSCTSDKIIIGTFKGEVFTMNKDLSDIKMIYDSENVYIRTICKDGNKYFIGFHNNGIEVIDLMGNYLERYSNQAHGNKKLPSNMIRQIIRRENGEIWIGTYKGLVIKQGKNLKTINFESGTGLPNSSIYQLVQGQNGGIWIGTWAGGIAYYRDCNYKFNHINPITEYGLKLESAITAFVERPNGEIWIASEHEGTNMFISTLKDISTLPAKPLIGKYNNFFIKDVKAFSKDKLAILDFNKGIIVYDINKKTLKTTIDSFHQLGLRLGNTVERITVSDDKIWVFADKLCSYNEKEGIVIYPINKEIAIKSNLRVWLIYIDSAHNVWLCTSQGLYMKHKYEKTIKKCLIGNPLENEIIYTCCEDKDGQLWIGTAGEGAYIYHPETDNTSRISPDTKINDLDIYSILRSKNNEMWFSSNKGIYHWNKENTLFQYTSEDGLSGNQFKPNTGFVCSNGKLLFGTTNGYNIISPDIIKKNTSAPKVMLAEIKINNQTLSKNNSINYNSLDTYNLKKVTLKKAHNTISFKVINNNYITPSKNKFKYRLINYNDTWTEIGNNKEISYTKIPSGNYVFEVYGSNNDNVWSKEPYQLAIKINPATWQYWYFIALYIIILLIISYFIYNNIKSRISLKKSIEEEKQQSQLNDEIHKERVKFFINISHEFRTPLTLILSPLNTLIKKYETDENTSKLLKTINRNSNRLLRLTNQTLDFRLLEMGKLKPKPTKTNIIQLVTDSYTYFEHRIREKRINFSFYSDFKLLQTMVDADMVEKIIFNLLSNAIDYTASNGQVKLTIKKTKITEDNYANTFYIGQKYIGTSIEIKVEDTGAGIIQEALPKLFHRFSKASDQQTSTTGIGLHLCGEYATLNGGNIIVHSSLGNGSSFILNLPFKDEFEVVSKQQQYIISLSSPEDESKETEEMTQSNNITTEDHSVNTLLIVDNNKELLSYFKKYFSLSFRVITANDKNQAMKVLNQITPDIILTELSLPDTDAYTYIEFIKKNKRFATIPIIVLTQLTETKYQTQCLELGIDIYLNKPIEDSLLLAHLNNLVKKQTKKTTSDQIKHISQNFNSSYLDSTTFAAVAEQLVLENLQNINFDANALAQKMKVSYSTFFRRIKRETGISATQFIRDIRLNKSIKLLKGSDLSIDEIGTSIGFNSTSYFVRSFKKKYDKTPSEYRKTE